MKILYFTLMPEWAIGVHKKINAQVKSLTKITNTKVIECKLQDEILYFDNEKKELFRVKRDEKNRRIFNIKKITK